MARSRSTASRRRASDALVLTKRLALILCIAGWALVLASLIGYDVADPPSHVVWPANAKVTNWCGPFGATVSYTLFKLLGFGAWPLVIFTGIGLLSAAMGAGLKHSLVRFAGLVLLSAAFSGLQHLLLPGTGSMPDLAGGLVGKVGATELALRFGSLGAGIFLFVGLLIGTLVAMDEWFLAAVSWTWDKTKEHGVPAARVAGAAAGEAALTAGATAAKATGKGARGLFQAFLALFRLSGAKRAVRVNDIDDDKPQEGVKKARRVRTVEIDIPDPDTAPVPAAVEPKPARPAPDQAASAIDADLTDEDELPSAPQVYSEDQLREKISKLPILFGQKDKTVATDADLAGMQTAIEEGEKYKFPGLDLLEEPEANFNEKLEEYVREQAAALVAALQQFRIDGTVDSVESGPVITLFHVRLSPGTKVSQLETVGKDIARVLKAQNVRIVSNMAGRDTVGIEVPNLHKEKVRLKELMAKTEVFSGMRLPTFLGKDASGEPLIEDLSKMPHMLIAGTTGSGKSVLMNTIIMGFLYTKKPSELKLVLVDPKMVELSQFKDIPHLMCPVVTEMSKAAAILEWATTKMDERYELLAEAGCRDISAYNELPWEELRERMNPQSPEAEARIPRKLPYMVFIIDELADLIMTKKDVEGHIIRIAQKARAVGIHLILATQRPQANVVTGLIKSNMPCRIGFKVASGMDSRIVLDQKGGELLLGHGDMLFLSPRSSKLTRAQGTLVDDREIRRVVKFMREVAAPSFERSLIQLRSGDDEQRISDSQNNSSASLQAAQEDPMFNRAVEIVLETKRGSVSLLQRRLAIGYTRASRLIDLMGIAGIISDHKGSVARDVLITIDDWARIKQLAAEEAKAKGIILREEGEPATDQTDLFDDDAESGDADEQSPAGSLADAGDSEEDEGDDRL